jgi:hypothetical protein
VTQIAVNSYLPESLSTTYTELVERSEIIVIGRILKAAETYNTARNPEDVSQPHPTLYSAGQVYFLAVEEILKGDAGSELYLVHPEGARLIDTESAGADGPGAGQLAAGERYLLFLARCCQSTSGRDIPDRVYYSGAAQPWLFALPENEGGLVTAVSDWAFAAQYFPPASLDEMRAYIADPASAPVYELENLPPADPLPLTPYP